MHIDLLLNYKEYPLNVFYSMNLVLEAMHFDIPKASDERYKNIRALTCQI
jgi:hypothetical protein